MRTCRRRQPRRLLLPHALVAPRSAGPRRSEWGCNKRTRVRVLYSIRFHNVIFAFSGAAHANLDLVGGFDHCTSVLRRSRHANPRRGDALAAAAPRSAHSRRSQGNRNNKLMYYYLIIDSELTWLCHFILNWRMFGSSSHKLGLCCQALLIAISQAPAAKWGRVAMGSASSSASASRGQ